LNSSGALEALTSASNRVPGPISQLVIDDDVSRLLEHMPARFGDDPRHMVQVNMSDDHHRDALGRNAGPLEILHHPRELTGRGPENIAETGIDQHTIGRGVDHK
jgi:hypothetical protein